MKIINLPVEEVEQIFIPDGFNQFLTFFGVVHRDGRSEIRWFVQSENEDISRGSVLVYHDDVYNRYPKHRESVINSIAQTGRRHVAILDGNRTHRFLVIHDVEALANKFAGTQESHEYKECLYSSLHNWLMKKKDLKDDVERLHYVKLLQNILFPYYIRRRMVDTFGASLTSAPVDQALYVYRQGSWSPPDHYVQTYWNDIVLHEFSVDC